MAKQKISRLPGGGFIIKTKLADFIFLDRRKIQVSYPKDLPLSEVKRFVDRAFRDLERRMS